MSPPAVGHVLTHLCMPRSSESSTSTSSLALSRSYQGHCSFLVAEEETDAELEKLYQGPQ